MSNYLQQFVFGLYPYVCAVVFLVGSLIRFDREQYTWKSDSSQLLRRGQLRLGSNLFHLGILGIFFGHLVGLLTPAAVFHALGISTPAKQMLAIVAGGVAGLVCIVGLVLLIHRRLTEPRIRATTRPMDLVVLFWILITLSLGLVSIFYSMQHREGGTMLALMSWAQHIVTFQAGAAEYVKGVDWIYRTHLFFGMTLFLLFPFSRLVHIWSGFAAIGYAVRPYQVVRPRS
jgi:nitrate reductase gamma subunit